MTSQNIIESVKDIFPKLREQRIVKDLDALQKMYCNETGILIAAGSLSSPSSNFAWSLPSDFIELYGNDPVRFYDSDGKPKYLGDYNYAYEIQFNKFYIYSLTSTVITGLDTGVDSAYIHYKKLPTTITSRSISLEIDEEFTKGLEHGLLADYFSKIPTLPDGNGNIVIRDLNTASWHQKRYEEYRVKGKRYANVRDSDKSSRVQNYQSAGYFQLPRRPKDSSLGATTVIQVTALSQIYSKWVLYNVGSGDSGSISPATTAVGYSTISASRSGTTLTVTSTAEFGNDTQIVCNNGDVGWTQSSSSTITFTLPSSFTQISIEIWERL